MTDQRKRQHIPKFKTLQNPFSNPNAIKLKINTKNFSTSTTQENQRNKQQK